ncbi:MAG TPA: hypothetical protein VN934_04720 [Candidatus Tumulicola sp.]|nr:hypothetical protein [Candidatus Tumulicola sp.]
MPTENERRQTAERFAAALDRDDFGEASELLAWDCRYEISNTEALLGPAAIVGSYRAHSERAKQSFDEVSYESQVETEKDGAIPVLFIDKIRKGSRHHVYSCRQFVSINAANRITKIRHEELQGERERLRRFLEET